MLIWCAAWMLILQDKPREPREDDPTATARTLYSVAKKEALKWSPEPLLCQIIPQYIKAPGGRATVWRYDFASREGCRPGLYEMRGYLVSTVRYYFMEKAEKVGSAYVLAEDPKVIVPEWGTL